MPDEIKELVQKREVPSHVLNQALQEGLLAPCWDGAQGVEFFVRVKAA